ncbi:MAG: AGE family epimerase/isomerase [Spirochaeta sp.]|jgi:mannose/cellobiose epimerase-like protein (N-acyl-D-glucosamine 2-epimerase family)|nr:AGE family epimerase/isomerase [Spirochaeta sp.]
MYPEFDSTIFLRDQISAVVDFYRPAAVDPDGGFYHCFRDDGSVCDTIGRHLVSSTRFVYLFATAARILGDTSLVPLVQHGLEYLYSGHYREATGGFLWEIEMAREDGSRSTDDSIVAYGMAFVILAGSAAVKAGIETGHELIRLAWRVLEEDFWEPKYGLYADRRSGDRRDLSPYRGQNANMHLCEACLAAYEAGGDIKFLDRAVTLAEALTRDRTIETDGLIWEHYRADWTVDWDFHRDKPNDLFRPWGYQPGHHVEWSKLLLEIQRYRPAEWIVPRARQLFDAAVRFGWDEKYTGLYYGFAPDRSITADDKYYWVHAEAIGAAALLHEATGAPQYRDWYERLWQYSWDHLVDHRYGGWFRILDRTNAPYSSLKSPPGKTGYHPVGACVTALSVYDSPAPQD